MKVAQCLTAQSQLSSECFFTSLIVQSAGFWYINPEVLIALEVLFLLVCYYDFKNATCNNYIRE